MGNSLKSRGGDLLSTMQKIDAVSSISRRTPAQAEREREQMRRGMEKLLETPELARAFFVRHGYITRGGKLGKIYRS